MCLSPKRLADTLYDASQLCAIAYLEQFEAGDRYQSLGWKSMALHEPRSVTEAYLLWAPGRAVIAVRGSDEIRDWSRRNLMILPEYIPELDSYVHGGAWLASELLWQRVRPALEAIKASHSKNFSLHIAGHSLGGAISQLLALRLRKHNPKVISLGAPRVGSVDFSKNYDLPLINAIHPLDIVPRTPMRCAGFRHAGEMTIWEGDRILTGRDAWNDCLELYRGSHMISNAINGTGIAAHYQYGAIQNIKSNQKNSNQKNQSESTGPGESCLYRSKVA